MNKKLFIGATAVTAVVVAGVVYYRHVVLRQVDKWLEDEDEQVLPKEAVREEEARG